MIFDFFNEALVKNNKDIYYNKDKFDSGEINLCFVTGHSGSGKSSMGSSMQKDGVEHYELDDLACVKDHFTMDNLREYGDLMHSYFNGQGKKFYTTYEELVNNNIKSDKYEDLLYPDFVHYVMKYAKSHKNKKIVIEGVWLFRVSEKGKAWFSPEEFKDYAFYIKGTSMLISKHRAAKRDCKAAGTEINIIRTYSNIFFKDDWRWYFLDEKNINKFRNYFSNLESVKESYIIENTKSSMDNNHKQNGKKSLSSFRKLAINNYANLYSDNKMIKHIKISNNTKGYLYIDKTNYLSAIVNVEYKDNGENWIQALEISDKYKGYGLSKQLLNVAIKDLKAQYLSVNKNNEVAKDIYDKYGFIVYDETNNMYFMRLKSIKEDYIEESTNNKLYFISENSKLKILNPRIPSNFMTKNGYEDSKTPRVCFSTDIGKCLMALSQKCTNHEYYVYTPNPNKNYKIISPTIKQVHGVKLTDEKWITEPVEVICIGKILCIGDKGEDGLSYKYGNNTAELYEWDWKWVKKYFIKESVANEMNYEDINGSDVYFTKEITSESLIKIFNKLNHPLHGKIGIKISTGEPGGHNFLSPDLIKGLVNQLNGTIIECNTAYPGKRNTFDTHWQAIKDHGFYNIAPCDIMDEDGDMELVVNDGYHLEKNLVGNHITRYNSILMLQHFKGHAMAGYGGALKNMSIGMASAKGKVNIHTAGTGTTFEEVMHHDRDEFLESMVDADKSVMEYIGRDNIIYINIANNLSVDCDCGAHPHDPEMGDIGIFASTDPVALDQACIDAVYNYDGEGTNKPLIKRIESRNGIHTIECAEQSGLGNRQYNLIDIDSIMNESNTEEDELLALPGIEYSGKLYTNHKLSVQELLDKTDPKHIYLTSDWHLFKNRFKKEANHVNTQEIISWCKQNIKSDDVFMYLGDMCYRWADEKASKEAQEIFKSLPGIKVLILGNHDIMQGPEFYNNCGFDYIFEEIKWQNYIFTHKPIQMEDYSDEYNNIHAHMHDYAEYNTTDGSKNVNVYPKYYGNKPVALKDLLKHKDKYMKNNKRSNWVGMGESNIFTDEDQIILKECSDMIENLLNKDTVNEWSMAAFNPVRGITKPYVLAAVDNSGDIINTKQYALSPDIVSDKYLVIDENSKLKIVEASYFDNALLEVYEYTGNDLNLAQIKKDYDAGVEVNSNYIYETLSGKELLSNDQIDFDECFSKLDIELFKSIRESEIATIQEQWDEVNNSSVSLPVLENTTINIINNSNEVSNWKNRLTLYEDMNGYYLKNDFSGKRTKSIKNIYSFTEAMIKSIY